MNTDILGKGMIVASGLDACEDILYDIRTGALQTDLVELLACKGGCVNGPRLAEASAASPWRGSGSWNSTPGGSRVSGSPAANGPPWSGPCRTGRCRSRNSPKSRSGRCSTG